MTTDTLLRLVEEFAEAAEEHYDALERMDEDAANTLAGRISLLYGRIVLEEEGREALLVLLESANPSIAGMAAVFSLRYATDRSLKVLKSIARQPGLMGFRAGIAVDRWERGEWEL